MDEVSGGSLYPALTRLERRGLVTTSTRPSSSGPARKYYELTPAGLTELAARREEWRAFRAAVSAVLDGSAHFVWAWRQAWGHSCYRREPKVRDMLFLIRK